MKSDVFGGGAKPGGVGGGGTPQSTVVSTRGTPAAEHPARRGSDPVIADVGQDGQMIIDPELVGYDDIHERKLYVMSVATPSEVPHAIRLESKRFACLVAWNADNVTNSDIAAVAHALLKSGAVYLSVWGHECERVHDIIDEVSVGPCPPPVLDKVVMTTWHADETLDQYGIHSIAPGLMRHTNKDVMRL